MQLFISVLSCAHTCTVPNGVNTDRCNPSCGVRQCCDRNEDGDYECFCLQAKVNSPKQYVKRPCESMLFVVHNLSLCQSHAFKIYLMSRLLRNCRCFSLIPLEVLVPQTFRNSVTLLTWSLVTLTLDPGGLKLE